MASTRTDRNVARPSNPDNRNTARAALDELDTVSATLTRVKQQLTARLQAVQSELERSVDRISTLEDENRALAGTVEELRAQLAALRTENEQLKAGERAISQVNFHIVIQERDKLRQQLRHSQKSLKDALNNKSSLDFSSPSERFKTCPETPQAMRGIEEPRRGEPSGAARLSPMGLSIPGAFSPVHSPLRNASAANEINKDDDKLDENEDSPYEVSVHGSVHSSYDGPIEIQEDTAEVWSWEPDGLPGTRFVAAGPFTWETMCDKLVLDDTMVEELKKAHETPNQQCLRLHILGNLAFVFEPIFLETPSSSYMVNWSDEHMVDRLQEFIWGEGPLEREYHTLICLAGEIGWYYIGKLIWRFVELPPHWSGLPDEMQDMLARTLKARWRTDLSLEDVMRRVEDSVQFTVELSRDGEKLERKSVSFARKKLGHTPRERI